MFEELPGDSQPNTQRQTVSRPVLMERLQARFIAHVVNCDNPVTVHQANRGLDRLAAQLGAGCRHVCSHKRDSTFHEQPRGLSRFIPVNHAMLRVGRISGNPTRLQGSAVHPH